ncbi:riboflavin synthase [Bacillus spongiae]|uniref:Riboflavin synthase n=1 Tax=Bacillus spongiae TaxID=2683610 RepID=A0ABU8HHP2_9BACI
MFTGLIEEIGVIQNIRAKRESLEVIVNCRKVLEDIKIGDSIAVNGVCLTVTSFTSSNFIADVMPETYHATSLKSLTKGTNVNLERAMRANGRFGGHFVSGHVDTVGIVETKEYRENAVYMKMRLADKKYMSFMMEKGSIAIDGTSLTIFSVLDDENSFSISLIPQTQQDTILTRKQIGDEVNIECDMVVKYMNRLMSRSRGVEESTSSMDLSFLQKHGFAE